MTEAPENAAWRLGGELIRFAITGGLATLTHVACYLLLFPALLDTAAAANVVAFTLAVFVSYLGNAYWVFPQNEFRKSQLAKFCLAALTGLALNTLFAWYIVDFRGLSRYLSIALMVGVTPLVVFVLNKFFVFTSDSQKN